MRSYPDLQSRAMQPKAARRPALLPVRVQRLTSISALCVATLLLTACEKKEEPREQPPPEVEVTDVVEQNVPVYKEWVAQLNGPVNADISPKVPGYLLKQNYQNGFFVHKGQLLYEIDPRPFVAALDQAKAQVAVAQANLSNAQTNVTRDTPLVAQNAIPRKQLDNDLAAQAANQAQLEAAQAQQVQAELNLEWTKVYSPIDGVAGVTNSNVGDLVGQTTKMTTISQVDPIWAYFNISESEYLSRAEMISRIVRGEKAVNNALPVEYIQANGVTFPAKGKIVLVNREVTAGTGAIQLAAAFPNKGGILRPGGFGSVRIQAGVIDHALLIPQAAVIEVQSQYVVGMVTPESKGEIRPVKVGERVGKDWIITEGLKPGDKVIVQGFMRARPGMTVIAKPYVAPSAPATPEGN